jgi:hypothetical protein
MTEFFIALLIWMGLLDPTATYTVSQVEQITATNSTAIQQATNSLDTTTVSWQNAQARVKETLIIDPLEL